MEATVCCWFYYWSEVQVVWKTIIVQSTYTRTIERSLLKWMGVTATVKCMMQFGFTVVMWQRSEIWLVLPTSGSGSNSLNSQKLPGHFSYGPGRRLSSLQLTLDADTVGSSLAPRPPLPAFVACSTKSTNFFCYTVYQHMIEVKCQWSSTSLV